MSPAETAARSACAVTDRRAPSWHYSAFGLIWSSTFPLPMPALAHGRTDVTLRLCESVDTLWSGNPSTPDWLFKIDGGPFVIQRGSAGDFRLAPRQGARFHVDRNASAISCEPTVLSDAASQRLLLDTVLWTTTLLHGIEGLHASAVQTESGVIAFMAASGGGKTSVAVELVRRGYPLFCDDVLMLERRDDDFVAHPSPPLMNLPTTLALDGLRVDPIAQIGDEAWVSVADIARQPSVLARLYVLNRAGGLEERIVAIDPTVLDLLPHAQVHALADGWERRRFELCSDLALNVPLSRIDVDPAASPSQIADLVETDLAAAEAS